LFVYFKHFFWVLHGLEVLGCRIKPKSDLCTWVIESIASLQHPEGGFGGNAGFTPHLAPTYASVHALAAIGTEEALNVINLPGLRSFLEKCHYITPPLLSSSLVAHTTHPFSTYGGCYFMESVMASESDCRSSYCALSVASLTRYMFSFLHRNNS
jgi:prenyltransferase beta subunit